MLSHFLPAGNPKRGGWSPAPHNCTTRLLSSQALLQRQKCGGRVLGSAGAPTVCHCCGQTLNRRALQPHRALSSGIAVSHLAPLHRRAAQHHLADVMGVPTQGQLDWHSHHEKPVYLGK